MAKKIRIVVVDDSLLIRQVLIKELNKTEDIEVVGSAVNPIEAKPVILQHKPDVVTLDVEMPRMDGLTFLKILQKFYPVPVVMLSTLTEAGSNIAIEALRNGAVEIMQKPGGGSFLALNRSIEDLVFKIKAASIAKRKKIFTTPTSENLTINTSFQEKTNTIIAIGSSTGGTEALRYITSRLPGNMPPILITQHMPEAFTASFANSLDKKSQLSISECNGTIPLRPGMALVARGGKHMGLRKTIAGYQAVAKEGEPVCHQCPSVDVMFQSVAKVAKNNVVGVILTGMGNDGAKGMLAMKISGAITIAQDEESCVVFGMPKEAIALNAAKHILPLEKIPKAIISAVKRIESASSLAAVH